MCVCVCVIVNCALCRPCEIMLKIPLFPTFKPIILLIFTDYSSIYYSSKLS